MLDVIQPLEVLGALPDTLPCKKKCLRVVLKRETQCFEILNAVVLF